MDFQLDIVNYFVNGVFPFLGDLLGYFQALGEMPLVYMNSFLRGDNVTWEIYNIFTQQTNLVTLYSYGSIATWLDGLNLGAFNAISGAISQLIDFVLEIFKPFGDLIYTIMFDYGTLSYNIPLWVGLIVTIPRMTLMFFAFKWFLSLFGVRI